MFQSQAAAARASGSAEHFGQIFNWPIRVPTSGLTTFGGSPAALQQQLPQLVSRAFARARPAKVSADGPFGRAMDIIVALGAIVFFAPLMLLITLAITVTTRGPVLFRQERLGKGGRRFKCLKFRTMRIDADRALAHLLSTDPAAQKEWLATQKLRYDPRTFRVGAFLRKTSLDELPQFFNVLFGEMSIVGPRPIVEDETLRYGQYISSYYAVRPGITGIWQVNGRNHTTYRRRVACDVLYARKKSSVRDVSIMAMTVPAVLFGRGAY